MVPGKTNLGESPLHVALSKKNMGVVSVPPETERLTAVPMIAVFETGWPSSSSTSGTGVFVGIGVLVAVAVGVLVGVSVAVAVGVLVEGSGVGSAQVTLRH